MKRGRATVATHDKQPTSQDSTMDSFFSELKKAREAKHLTLSDIADATSINVKLLEAIEQGHTSILPEPYVRAFIREYASVVDLDPAEVLRNYEATTAPKPLETGGQQTPVEPVPPGPFLSDHETAGPGRPSPGLALGAIIVMAVAALLLVLWNLWHWPEKGPTSENAVMDSTHTSSSLSPADSAGIAVLPARPSGHPSSDSLTLTARAIDSVWILIQVDGLPPRDFILHPGSRPSWKAREKFVLTVGNAGGLEVTLNQKRFGVLGKRGAVVRSMEFNRQSLTKR